MPDGRRISATHVGPVALSPDFIIPSIFYVPGLDCNILSVAQLTDFFRSIILFTPSSCFLQDPLTKQTSKLGDRHGKVYLFAHSSRVSATVAASSEDLWHHRLGHPSNKLL